MEGRGALRIGFLMAFAPMVDDDCSNCRCCSCCLVGVERDLHAPALNWSGTRLFFFKYLPESTVHTSPVLLLGASLLL